MTSSSLSATLSSTPILCSSFTAVESPILRPVHDLMDMLPLSSSLTSTEFDGSVEHYFPPIKGLEGVSRTVIMDEQSEEDMSFLFQDMMRHSVSPSTASIHAHPEAGFNQSWKKNGYSLPHAQVWPAVSHSNNCNSMLASVDRFGMGSHFDLGQADLVIYSAVNRASLGNEEPMSQQDHPQLQLQNYPSLAMQRAHHQDPLEINSSYGGLSGLQIEQCAPGQIVIGMGCQPMLSNNTYDSSSALSDHRFPSQDLSSLYGVSVFPYQQIDEDTSMTQTTTDYDMLNNAIRNYNQLNNNLASTITTYDNQELSLSRAVATTTPLPVQFESVNHLPKVVPMPEVHSSLLGFPLVKAYTPTETTYPFPTPCDTVPVFLHHPNTVPSYFPPMVSLDPQVAPSRGGADRTMIPHPIVPSMVINASSEAPAHCQSIGPVDSSVAMAMVTTHLSQPWPNVIQSQVTPHALQSLELTRRLQAVQQQQQQLQQQRTHLEFNRGAIYHHYQGELDPVSGDSGLSTTPSTATPLPDTPASTVPFATPQQFQDFLDGTVNMSAIHPSRNHEYENSLSAPENAQMLVVNHGHSEDFDIEQDDEDEEGCTVESDGGDSNHYDEGNNIRSSNYLEEEDDDSDDDILLHRKRTPSSLSSPSVVDDSSEDTPKRHCSMTVMACRDRIPCSPTEASPEPWQPLSSETQSNSRRKPATRVRRARSPHILESVEDAVKHIPSTEAQAKSRKPRTRRITTRTQHPEANDEVDEDDDIPSTLHAPSILEDGSIMCTYRGCPRTFATMGLLRSHLVVHVDGKPYVCDMCDGAKRYKRNHDLLRHQREIHGEEEEKEEQGDNAKDEVEDGRDDTNGSQVHVHRRLKREEGKNSRGGASSGRHRKHRRTRVEHRTIWNGSEMEEIEVEMVRPRGRPRVRPLKDTPAADAFALISSSSSSSMARTARPQAHSQSADAAKRLHEWLRIEAQATAAWSTAQEPTDYSHGGNTGSYPPLFVEESEPNQLIKHEEDELVMTGQWCALNARAANIQNQDSVYALRNLKEWISAPEGSSPRSLGNMVETMLHAPEAFASPTCNVAANIVAAATKRGMATI